MKHWFKKTFRVLKYIVDDFFENDCANRAASLAYTVLLSLVPVVMVSFWILSLFPAFSGIGLELQKFIVGNFVAHSAEMVSEQIEHFLDQTRELSWSNLIALVVVSVLMIYDITTAFNSIWHVKARRHLVLSFSFYSLILLMAPIVLGVFMVVSAHLAALPFIENMAFLGKTFFSVLPFLVAFVGFTLANWALPSCAVPFRFAVLAGLITTILFEIVKYCFGLYMSYFPTYRLIYGALAAIPIFLLWIYTCWVIVLLGALVCRIMSQGIPDSVINPPVESAGPH
jgi:membrane protein